MFGCVPCVVSRIAASVSVGGRMVDVFMWIEVVFVEVFDEASVVSTVVEPVR